MPVINTQQFPLVDSGKSVDVVSPLFTSRGFDFTQIDTRLAAINLCLAVLGRAGVADASSPNVDAQMASREVDRVSYQTQHKGGAGWWFNRENSWILKPNQDGMIVLPNNVLSVLVARCGTQPIRGFTYRGDKLYDTVTHSFDLRDRLNQLGSDSLNLDLVLQLPYEELPPSAKMFIAYRAAYNFSGQQEFDANKLQVLQLTMQESQADMEAEENSQQSNNYWEQSGTMNMFADMAAQGDSSFFFNRPNIKGFNR